MRFHIGPWEYHVVVSGKDSRAEFESRTIYLAESLPVSRRWEVLLHELVHCWLFYVPRPRDEEEMARLLSLVGIAGRKELDAQGGIDELRYLKAIRPGREVVHVRDEWSQVA
jgi:hypothetical protein